MNNFRQIIFSRVKLASGQLELLKSIIGRNDSYIMADVDESKQLEFLEDFKNKTGQDVDINHEGIFIRKMEHRIERNKKQLRLFFNASPEEIIQLQKTGLFINQSKGATRLWKRGEFKYILDNNDLIYSLIKFGGFNLGENKNYKESLHETNEEKELEKQYHIIAEKLQELDLDSPEAIQLKNQKSEIIDKLNELEQKRLMPIKAKNFRKNITARVKSK